MTAAIAPHPLRILLAWPNPPARDLRRALRKLSPAVEVDLVGPAEASGHLAGASYFHVLYFALAEWRGLAQSVRERYVRHAVLLVLGPDPATPADFEGAAAGVYLPRALVLADALASLVELHDRLGREWPLDRCATESSGRLVLVGTATCWPEAPVLPPPTAVGPSRASQVSGPGPMAGNPLVGHVNVAGDLVSGDKIVHQAAGDQVISGTFHAGKIVQQAGHDQVNVTRAAGRPEISQTAGGDQVNLNTQLGAAEGLARLCPQCENQVRVDHKYCEKCGATL